ncbi:polysaccharide deacetylase family protein [Paenibacillus sp. D2_2]|uniref:polysaccharide deacetylase family protein n=1 Tax=Paenibacillus sp. D2_2 TaxID=3073092 RepID=UPI0028162216|nr:polysaccharide deacetylase family protein [Paenibacillus sp. D2_2]WMT41719.1 polysaccharide deacetylase family protein [Paenibacillus sp. D2_2]
MSVYLGKVLELQSVCSQANQSYITIKISSEQEQGTEVLWKIDDITADHLKAIVEQELEPDIVYKYRLSFYSEWDSAKKYYVSYLTRTYCEQSERVYFTCSEQYVHELQMIRNCESLDELKFLTSLLEATENPDSSNVENARSYRRLNRRLIWSATALMSIIILILVGSTVPAFSYKMASGKDDGISPIGSMTKTADSIVELASNSETGTITAVNPQFKAVAEEETTKPVSVAAKPVSELHVQSVELSETVNFNIPKGTVALTFDDGPSKYTEKIADVLKEYQVGGTFFFIGENVEKHPKSVQYVKNHGYSIGSHSMHHLELTKQSKAKQKYEITHPNELIEKLTGEPVVLFAHPMEPRIKLSSIS